MSIEGPTFVPQVITLEQIQEAVLNLYNTASEVNPGESLLDQKIR